MAAIDKIYANKADAETIVAFLKEHRDEIMARCTLDPMRCVYSQDWNDWDETSEDYNPSKEHPVTNFPLAIEVCIAQMDNLPQPIIEGLRWCHSDEWIDMVREAKGKGGKYDFERWHYVPAKKFVLDFKNYKFNDKNNNKLCLARGYVDVSASYFGKENTSEYGTTLWFDCDDNDNEVGWHTLDVFDIHIPKYKWGSNDASVKAKTMKSLIRWVRKMNFPKDTVLSCSTGWVGGNFKIHCK